MNVVNVLYVSMIVRCQCLGLAVRVLMSGRSCLMLDIFHTHRHIWVHCVLLVRVSVRCRCLWYWTRISNSTQNLECFLMY